jgi:Na+/melibiose symporter-like transporter
VLHLAGWDTTRQAAQDAGTFLAMRITFAGGTVVLAGVAACIIQRYTLTAETVRAAQARAAAAAAG